jgi:hypothetical protein
MTSQSRHICGEFSTLDRTSASPGRVMSAFVSCLLRDPVVSRNRIEPRSSRVRW